MGINNYEDLVFNNCVERLYLAIIERHKYNGQFGGDSTIAKPHINVHEIHKAVTSGEGTYFFIGSVIRSIKNRPDVHVIIDEAWKLYETYMIMEL